MTTVRSIFIDLRPYAKKEDRIFLDFADFVAHPSREQGVIKQGLEFMMNQGLYFYQYYLGESTLDLLSPFPSYIKEIMIYMIDIVDPNNFKKRGFTKSILKKFVNDSFEEKEEKILCIRKEIFQDKETPNVEEKLKILKSLIETIVNAPIYTQSKIIDSMIRVIKNNGIIIKDALIKRWEDQIMIHILANLHKSIYTLKDGTKVTCYIGGITRRFEDTPNGRMTVSPKLRLRAALDTKKKLFNTNIGFQFEAQIISTNLIAASWCDESLFTEFPKELQFGNNGTGTFEDHDLIVNEDYILTPLPYEGKGTVLIGM